MNLRCSTNIFPDEINADGTTAAPLWWWWWEAAIFAACWEQGWPLTRPSGFFHILNEDWWKNVTTTYTNIYPISFYNRKKMLNCINFLIIHYLLCHVNTNVDFFVVFYDHYHYLWSGSWESVAPAILCRKTAKTWRNYSTGRSLKRTRVFLFLSTRFQFWGSFAERGNASVCCMFSDMLPRQTPNQFAHIRRHYCI